MLREPKESHGLGDAEDADELLDIFVFREKPFRGAFLDGSDSDSGPSQPAAASASGAGGPRLDSPGAVLDPSFFPSAKGGRGRKRQRSSRNNAMGSSLIDPVQSSSGPSVVAVSHSASRAAHTPQPQSSSASSSSLILSSSSSRAGKKAAPPVVLLDLASSDEGEDGDDGESELRDNRSEAHPSQQKAIAVGSVESSFRDRNRSSTAQSSSSQSSSASSSKAAAAELLHLLHRSKSRYLEAPAPAQPRVAPADTEDALVIPKILTAAERAEALTKRHRGGNEVSSGSAPPLGGGSASSQQEGGQIQMLRLKSRLNGKHDWKWKVSMSDKFLKLKTKFAEVYGLSPAVITFRFDGDVIEDDACPEDVGLEDEDLIDAQVDKTLFEAAVASANSRKNSNL